MNRYIKATYTIILLFVLTAAVNAQPSRNFSIPEPIKSNILNRHPTAIDFHSGHEIYFSHYLLEVVYKEKGSKTEISELFSEDGKLFANEITAENQNAAPAVVKEALQNSFQVYALKKVELIGNPDGLDKADETYLLVGNVSWKGAMYQKGNRLERVHHE